MINFAKFGGGMNRRGFVLAMRLMGLGWYVALSIILGAIGGLWLDRRLDTLPLFTLIGVLLGTVLAFYGLIKMVRPLMGGKDGVSRQ